LRVRVAIHERVLRAGAEFVSARSPTADRPELLERPICFFGGFPLAGDRTKQKIGSRRADTSRGATQGGPQRMTRDEPGHTGWQADGYAPRMITNPPRAKGGDVVSVRIAAGSSKGHLADQKLKRGMTGRRIACRLRRDRCSNVADVVAVTVSSPRPPGAHSARHAPLLGLAAWCFAGLRRAGAAYALTCRARTPRRTASLASPAAGRGR
jgi:hypothetical protein